MQDNNNKENDLISVGEAHYDNGEYEEAIKVFSELLKLNPNNYDGLCGLGLSYGENGEYDKSIETLLKAVELKPNEYDSLALLGKSYYINNQYKETLQYFLKAYELNPKKFDCWDWLGASYYENGDYDKAIEYLLKAVELNSHDNYVLYMLGFAYEEKRQYREAAGAFIKANNGWVEFYIEFANKLLEFKNNRKELIDKIKLMFNNIKIEIPKIMNEEDIDPFTIFGLFNKGVSNRRTKILKGIANIFEINSKVPKEFYCVPVYRNFNSNFYNPSQNAKSDIDNLWNIFEAAIIKSNNYEFKNFYELSDYALYIVCTTRNKKEGNIMNIENNFNNSNKYDKNNFLQEVYITENEYDKLVKLITEKKNIILQG